MPTPEQLADPEAWFRAVPVPALLRMARGVYAGAIRAALDGAGCDDVPRNGAYVIASIARERAPMKDVISYLGTSKQAAGQLVDTLVARGYFERQPDPEDRRRVHLALTERGTGAARTIRDAVDEVDRALTERIGQHGVDQLRVGLAALFELRRDASAS